MTRTQTGFLYKFIGDRAFYRKALGIAIPIMLQNGITNLVNLLDNVMVGRVGMEQMSGVAIVNQLLFVFNLCIFGAISGVGIYTAQYYGQQDDEGIRKTVRFKFQLGIAVILIGLCIFGFFGEDLIRSYLSGGSDGGDLEATLGYGLQYLHIMMIYTVPFVLQQIYSSTLRECGETVIPMRAGLIAVVVNLSLNYVLIYGKLGMPALGIVGAGIATIIARIVEMLIVIVWTHTHAERMTFVDGLHSTILVPVSLAKKLIITGLPLLLNETLWAMSMAITAQCYSVRGLNVVAGVNIANTVHNVFVVVFIAMGTTVSIMVGHLLGANEMEEAVDTDNKMIGLALMVSVPVSIMLFIVAPLFPQVYNTSVESRHLATQLIMAQGVFSFQTAFINIAYFTMRSGGKTVITFFFDSVFSMCVEVPVAFILSRYTQLGVVWIFVGVQLAGWIKIAVGIILLKKKVWLNHLE